jgi:hypothetical protein
MRHLARLGARGSLRASIAHLLPPVSMNEMIDLAGYEPVPRWQQGHDGQFRIAYLCTTAPTMLLCAIARTALECNYIQ